MNTTILTRDGTRVMGISAVVLATLAALLAIFALAKPSEAEDTNIVTVEPAEVGFGAVEVGTDSETRTIYVRNTSDSVVRLGIDALGGTLADFELVGHSLGDVLIIQPNSTEPVKIKFSPSSPGGQLATLNLTALSGGISPIGVDLSGTGTTQPPNQQPGVQSGCTIIGTNNGETLTGTPRKDVICALGGRDRVSAMAGNDKVLGGRGNDVVRSSKGRDTLNGGIGADRLTDKAGRRGDRLFGKGGRDTLNAKDGKRGDLLVGGARRDKAFKDRGDRVRSI